MSWMVPRMLDVWVQATKTVLSLSKGARFSGVCFRAGPCDASPIHHLTTRFWCSAIRSQLETLASWSRAEMMTSEPAGKVKV